MFFCLFVFWLLSVTVGHWGHAHDNTTRTRTHTRSCFMRFGKTMNETALCGMGASAVSLRLPHHKIAQVQLSRDVAGVRSILTAPGASSGVTATCVQGGATRQLVGLPPLVSALCVSHNRPTKLTRSIALWWAQSYPRLELVLAFDEVDVTTAALAARALERSKRLQAAHTFVRRVLLHTISNRSMALGALR